jgi:hypothetical protein
MGFGRLGIVMQRNTRVRFSIGTAFILAAALSGCSDGGLIDRVPTELGGLPAGTPPRTASRPSFPAVHDVPPPRSGAATALSDQDQLKLEEDLAAARKRQGTLQDPTVKKRGEAASAAGTTAMETAKAAAAKKNPPAATGQ